MTNEAESQQALESSFDERFIEDYLGAKMSTDVLTAIVELIANSWDAGAKNVEIEWPKDESERFSISDNGHGLTKDQFSSRWTQLSYNRLRDQGLKVEAPEDNDIKTVRKPYGRNGKGRFAAFCFSKNEYLVETKRDSQHSCFSVRMSSGNQPFTYRTVPLPEHSKLIHSFHGTAIFVNSIKHVGMSEEKIRSEIGLRFLTDPDFAVAVNGTRVKFGDIDMQKVTELSFEFESQKVTIRAIQTDKSDKTTQQHGVAWHANNRLIGECDWNGHRSDHILDGRTTYAKTYTFIVDASLISEHVEADWSGFKASEAVLNFYDLAKHTIGFYLLDLSKENRKQTSERLRDNNRIVLSQTGMIGISRWNAFIDRVQVDCPKVRDPELEAIASILANLEASTYQYSLIHKLKEYTSSDLDDLTSVLNDWNITSAKAVLDEIKSRLTLVQSIREKVGDPSTLEVQELQPLFKKGLWIFGPEFESIEYTSNEGMTSVLSKLFNTDQRGSRNRPDFVVLPDGAVSLYGCYEYDDLGAERGIKKVVVVELKKPNVPLGESEKNQCWKYAKELYEKGVVLKDAKIECYLLGDTIEKEESGIDTKRDGDVRIIPLVYDTVLRRAESRLLNLHKKIKNAPFLDQSEIQAFLKENTVQLNDQVRLAI